MWNLLMFARVALMLGGPLGGMAAGQNLEKPGSALKRLGARTGDSALVCWPRWKEDTEKLQRQNEFTYVVIGVDWKGGIAGLKYLKPALGVRGVMFSHPDFSDEWCLCLRELKGLREVYVMGKRFTDKGMESLRHLRDLEALSLLETQVTDKGLACLKEMTKLQMLRLARSDGITDKGLAILEKMRELRKLDLYLTNTSGDGNVHLQNATKMEWLRLSGCSFIVKGTGDDNCRFANAGLRHLLKMENLRYLSIGDMVVCVEEETKLLKKKEASKWTDRDSLRHFRSQAATMRAVLKVAKNLEGINTDDGKFTRNGWKLNELYHKETEQDINKLLDKDEKKAEQIWNEMFGKKEESREDKEMKKGNK
jgi:hypothetical protein